MAEGKRFNNLAELVNGLKTVTEETQQTFANLNSRQLNWKPGPEQWSVAQCFDHLLTANESYFPIFERIASGQKDKNTFWESMPVLPAIFGGMLIKSLDPASKRKMKAPKPFEPLESDIDDQIINRFVSQQKSLAEAMTGLEGRDLDAVKITSPALKIITYSLRDACTIIVVHEQRHFQQAQRVIAMPEFPKS